MRRSSLPVAIAATLAVVAGVARPIAAQVIVAGPTTGDLLASVGDRVTMPVAIDMTGASGYDLGAFRARFSWNPLLFDLVNTTGGTFAPPVFNTDSAPQGVVRFAAASANGANGIFTLANVTLEVVATAPDTFRVTFDELSASGTFTDLLPFLTVTTGAFCGAGVWGDLDGNGQVQSLDAQIVLMYSVGLDVSGSASDIGSGDVTADGSIDPRDALIILSDVVGLTIPPQFPVGQPVSTACSPGDPATVTVLPTPVSLAPGDQFRLSAQVRDTASILLTGKNLAWSSNDPSKATVDSTGLVTALDTGAVTIMASVQPGVNGSASVTVGERHRWVVNPSGAQSDELGSDLLPFSTIAAATARANPNDTVFISLGTYNEPLDVSKALWIVGDSSAAGMPTISTPNARLGTLTAGGAIRLRRLQFEKASEGLLMRVGNANLRSVSIRSVNGAGLAIIGAGRAVLNGVTVSSVIGGGIGIDSAGFVSVTNTNVSAVEAALVDTTFGIGVRADTAVFDGVRVQAVDGQAIVTVDTKLTRVRRTTVTDADAGIFAEAGVRVEIIDTVQVMRVSDGAIGAVADTMVVRDVTVSDVGGSAIFLVDQAYDWLSVANVTVADAEGMIASVYVGGRADITNSQFSSIGIGPIAPNADTLTVDSVTVDGTEGAAILLGSAEIAYVSNSRLLNVVDGGIVEYGYTPYLELTNTTIRGVRGNGYAIAFEGDSLSMVGDTVAGVAQYQGLYAYGTGTGTGWVRIRDSEFRGLADGAVYAQGYQVVDIANVTLDSTTQVYGGGSYAVYTSSVDSVRIDSSRVRHNRGGGVYAYYSRVVTMQGNTIANNYTEYAGSGYTGYATVYIYYVDNSRFVDNTLTGNFGTGVEYYFTSTGDSALVQNNVFHGIAPGIEAYGYDTLTTRLEIRDNTFTGTLDDNYETIVIDANWINALVIENNAFDSIIGGLVEGGPFDSLSLFGNAGTNIASGEYNNAFNVYRGRLAIVDSNSVTCVPENGEYGIRVTAASATLTDNLVSGCRRGVYVYNTYYTTLAFDYDMHGNTIEQGTATTPQDIGIGVYGGSDNVLITQNSVSGGDYGTGAISVDAASLSYPYPRVEIISNTVSGAAGYGIRVSESDTVVVDNNSVSGLASTGVSQAALGFWNIAGPATVTRNTVTGNGVKGIYVDGTASGIVIDTNLVADNTGAGIVLKGMASGTLNSIRRNAIYGIVDSSSTGRSSFPANNIEANGFGIANFSPDTLFATGVWWGDALGPSCDIALGCDAGAVGDSVTALVDFSGLAADTVAGTPAGAPMAAPMLSLSPAWTSMPTTETAPVATPSVPTTDTDARVAPSDRRPTRARPTETTTVTVLRNGRLVAVRHPIERRERQ